MQRFLFSLLDTFTLGKMTEELGKIMDKYTKSVPVQKPFNLPKLNKQPMLKLPKLNKV